MSTCTPEHFNCPVCWWYFVLVCLGQQDASSSVDSFVNIARLLCQPKSNDLETIFPTP